MSLVDDVARYYAERAPVYDETAGYTDPDAEELRAHIKDRYRRMFRGKAVLEIACGTGYWTSVVAEAASSVLAVDINPSLIAQAKRRCSRLSNVEFRIADAYSLDSVHGVFNAAFGIWWWSHMPLELIAGFLSILHERLLPSAFVLFVDQLPYEGHSRRRDAAGNTLEERCLPDGRRFEIVKNFPTEEDIRTALAGIAQDMKYAISGNEKSWSVTYNTL